MTGKDIPVSIVGYRLEEEADVIPVSEVEFEAKQAKEKEKAQAKEAKKAENYEKNIQKLEYQRKLNQMDMETMLKIKEYRDKMKKNYKKSSDGMTGS